MRGDEVDQVGAGDDLAQHAAGGGYEQDGANGLEGIVGQLVEVLHLAGLSKQHNAQDEANGKRDDGLAKEHNQGNAYAAHAEGAGQAHQDDGNHDGSEGEPGAGQLAVAGNQLLIGLADGLGVGGFVGSLYLLADEQGKHVASNHGQDGAQRANAHYQQQVYLKAHAAVEGVGRRDGARRGRNEAVGNVEAHGKRHRARHGGLAGALHQRLTDGVEDNKAAVAEYGDGHDPAHDNHSGFGMLFANQLYDAFGHFDRSAGLFQQDANKGAQNDDDTN